MSPYLNILGFCGMSLKDSLQFFPIFGFSKNSGNHTDGFSFGGWSLLAASPVVRETPAMEQGNERETPASERRTACEA